MPLNLYDVNKSLLSATMLLVAASSLHAQKAKVDYQGQSKIIDISKITSTGCILSINGTTRYYEGECVVELKAIYRNLEKYLFNDKYH